MPDIHTRDAVYIRNLNGYTAIAYPPLYVRASTEKIPARFEGAEFSDDQAEILARTIAPQLFPAVGEEPWRQPVREIYKELEETVSSYRKDLRAAQSANWEAKDILISLSALLSALEIPLDDLEKLL